MSRNDELFLRAQRTIPAGVNSPVRAFRSVGGTPRFFTRGDGAYLWDADGKRYIDYVGSWGPAIVGHAHPEVIRAVQETAARGLSFGAPTELEIELAEMLVRRMPSLELVRLVSSGTEATMSALRLARGYTSRSKIVKFEGCYHGHGDSLLVKAGSGACRTAPGCGPDAGPPPPNPDLQDRAARPTAWQLSLERVDPRRPAPSGAVHDWPTPDVRWPR